MTATAPGRETDFVWRGRFASLVEGYDGWRIPRIDVEEELDRAQRVVVVDPLSFPWDALRPRHERKPLVICIDDDDVAEVVDAVIGAGGLASRITPFDTVLRDRAELPDALAAPAPAPFGKDQFLVLVEHLATELDVVGRTFGLEAPLVSVHGTSTRPFEGWLEARATARRAEPGAHGCAHAAVVLLLDDAPTETADVRAAIDEAMRALTPGGSLVVVGDVVTAPGGPARPWLSELCTVVDAAAGGAVSVEEIRAVRWPGEILTRGVLLRYHALVLSDDGGTA
ncbi:hypothetical protein CLV28_1995 [Sediminihabitans luteus]|uniref:Uncharacterized protein n=1 Tax=Sediminihabitans luteus TaxID=1138585 RepID=A0A2M9CE04_9CELL|nr:hypothetical protein [Sediminihabitans luteus]PJJ70166.1 hypothetical protein CLV28_1995 [Sediminihabitans luteus]GII97637.1 hypothetical protein Slu03_00150 [Sediminihabitans luteus]